MRVNNGNKRVSVSISTGSTFAVFCLIVLCHVIKKIRSRCANKRNVNIEQLLFERDEYFGSSDSEDSDDALLKFMDVERELPDVIIKHHPTTTTVNLDTY